MCGIAGWFHGPADALALRAMLAAIEHRGPESIGAYDDDFAHLGHARLSIVDVEGGQQPLTNEDETIWVICNGEIYNYPELRDELIKRGHRFRTGSDCEALVHLYEEYGERSFAMLNGQYALALWDSRSRRLMLCRDRLGICPLFYTFVGDTLYFASEIKALLQIPQVLAEPDLDSLGAIWTTWALPPGHTAFNNISELLPAHYAVVKPGDRELAPQRYWQLDFTTRQWRFDDALAAFSALLHDSVRVRLQADVPVGAYLSGGLDSSIISSLAREYASELHTFSIAFAHPDYDESEYQKLVAAHLGTEHHVVFCDRETLAAELPNMVYHTEAPQLRAGPVSMSLLSQSVNRHGFKVVLTGEGSDEFLLGYDLFKETAVRRFMARDPGSAMRRRLTRHLYPYLPDRDKMQKGLELMFQQRLDHAQDRFFSHDLRWNKVARLQSYFLPEVRAQFTSGLIERQMEQLLPAGFESWDWAAQAQAVEIQTFMTPYLLGPQGDRVAMAHAVEGRFPFLDHRLIELVNTFPVSFKMRTLTQDKHILRHMASTRLPAAIAHRPKEPYRAPVQEIVRASASRYVDDLLTSEALRDVGLFAPEPSQRLLAKVRGGERFSEMDEMALFGIITTQLWYQTFIQARRPVSSPAPLNVIGL
jgi:asparagine synthase (glutamine-hydrolysing)